MIGDANFGDKACADACHQHPLELKALEAWRVPT
jgi:hypothetical protein